MIPDLSAVFSRYESLRAEADTLFARVREAQPHCVTCKEGCSDCCHALFDLSLVEAMYLNRAFSRTFEHGPERSAILSRAAETDRRLTRLKRDLFRAEKDGESPEAIMARAAQIKLRCPLLGDDRRCLLYESRPVTCRIYGVPTAIAGQGHVCGFSAFEKGKPYPTVHLDKMQARLEDLSRELAKTVQSRFTELHEVYVPLSMALLTTYDETYLGIGPAKPEA
ncbi:YkgJ family cysteine cluster protein [Desulfovibrio sp. ZJ200]|uniref:YkgJ family cysteine cluster protein n=1 Tax=Desulfovibrio sp. ZJ200 TaxID=2709792 RepID=UPI0013E9BC73|nr:YkgJ family cysteine cluster protein [Desulfovibrio sp. ZJ200]